MATLPNIVFLDDFENAARSLLNLPALMSRANVTIHTQPLVGEALVAALQPADVVVLMRDRTHFSGALASSLPKLKLVIFTGTRNSAVDAAALAARKIPVCYTARGPSKDSTTELTWALILAAQKKLAQHLSGLRAGQWRVANTPLMPMLRYKTIGVIGLGEIGKRVAEIAQAFGMNVMTWSPNMTPDRAFASGATMETLDTLVKSSDIVTLHLVLSETTKRIFGAEQFSAMKSGALFVNTARAGLVDEAAMVAALKSGALGHAALDVFDEEPLPENHTLLSLHNVTLSPHLGFVCEDVFAKFYEDINECLEAWLGGKPLPRVLEKF